MGRWARQVICSSLYKGLSIQHAWLGVLPATMLEYVVGLHPATCVLCTGANNEHLPFLINQGPRESVACLHAMWSQRAPDHRVPSQSLYSLKAAALGLTWVTSEALF